MLVGNVAFEMVGPAERPRTQVAHVLALSRVRHLVTFQVHLHIESTLANVAFVNLVSLILNGVGFGVELQPAQIRNFLKTEIKEHTV